MSTENEQRSARIDNGRFFILVVIVIAAMLVTTCCLSILFLNQRRQPRLTPQQETPVSSIPTESLPKVLPTSYYSIHLPIILSAPVSVSASEQIWIVTKIKYQGYAVGGRRYDLATLMRVDNHDTVKAYCINWGWDTPDIGTEYLLNAAGVFVPVVEPEKDPFQRFLMIK